MAKSNKKHESATAFHAASADASSHVVAFGNLRVMISQETDGAWIAQGLEIDYFAQGESLEAAKESFADGLAATVKEHLQFYGTIKGLLVVAPPEAWQAFYAAQKCLVHSQISFHETTPVLEKTGFMGADFYAQKAA